MTDPATNEQAKNAEKRPRAKATAEAGKEPTSGPTGPFLEAHQRYLTEMQLAAEREDVGERVAQTYRTYLEAAQPPPDGDPAETSVIEDGASSKAKGLPSSAEEAEAAYRSFWKRFAKTEQAQGDEKVASAFASFADALVDAARTAYDDAWDAYNHYVRTVKEAWGSLDSDTLDPAALAALGASGATVANLHAAACGEILRRLQATSDLATTASAAAKMATLPQT